jgi:hypothetical protein
MVEFINYVLRCLFCDGLVSGRIYFLLYYYDFEIMVIDIVVAVALCFVALFVQRTASTTCPGPCNGSSNGLLGD